MGESGKFHSHSHRYPGTHSLYSSNCLLSYQSNLSETLCILALALLLVMLLLPVVEISYNATLQIRSSINYSTSLP